MNAGQLAKAQAEVTKFGAHFDANCDQYLPDEPTERRKKGEPAVWNHPKRWWQAQCAFRGLKTDGNISDLHERIRNRDKSKDVAISREQEALWAPIKEALKLQPDQEPLRSVAMPRTKQTARRGGHHGQNSRQVAEQDEDDFMHDEHGSSDQPGSSKESPPPPRKKQTARRGGVKASSSCRASTSTTKNARVSKSTKKVDWDITGEWDIECEELSSYFSGNDSADLSMSISHDTSKPGSYMATFDFNVIEGIMRITCPKPKSSRVVGTYIYRGRETGEGVIQLGSDRKSYGITFGDNGSSLQGEFSGSGVGHVSFIGSKVSKGLQKKTESAAQWEEFSERAYEEARINRW